MTIAENTQLNTETARFVIVEHLQFLISLPSIEKSKDTILFWNNSDGWGDLRNATSFTFQEMLSTRLPMGADVRWANVDDLARVEYRAIFETRADLMGLPNFVWLTSDTADNPCVWANHYTCEDCDATWTDHWSCQCDDTCPKCGTSLAPASSEWVGPDEAHWAELWEALQEKV